ncbi:hypothetical protein C8J56DRAFT_890309 [Mycena floridula]|nr:hypothetical protein C8J56DRAFT_890309 [Mycena floridula]
MPSVHASSIASSCQASPHTKIPSTSQEPLNPEIAVLPAALSSPVVSSSPDATEPVAKPNELEGDEETPLAKEAKAKKKRGKPFPSPAVPSGGLPKLTSPVMPASNAPIYRELIENPEPRLPLSADQMNRLQIGADNLNYWGYVIDIMYQQLPEVSNPIQLVVLITTITQQQNDFTIANACQEMDFPETSYIFQLRSTVMRWF